MKDSNKKNKNSKMEILQNLTMIGQLGLSLAMPLLLCLGLCYLLVTRAGLGQWVYFVGFFLGLGASFMTAYKVYLSATGSGHGDEEEQDFKMSRHI